MTRTAGTTDRVELTLGGETVAARGDRTLHWPARSTLVAADLHWGKGESFRAVGLPFPAAVADGVLGDDLARLDAALAATGARRLLVLGDLVHARDGVTARLVARLAAWRRAAAARGLERFELVPGNHDRHLDAMPEGWGVTVRAATLDEGPFRFRHLPPRAAAAGGAAAGGGGVYTLCGHLHPVVRLRGGGDSLRLPCFHLGRRRAVLPAFSLFTGGTAVRRRPGDRVLAVADGAVVEV